MSGCEQLAVEASGGIAPALRAVDCLSNEMAAGAFGRLFGTQGALLPVLTILLTIYIALFAFALITGRSRLGVSALTPRMLTVGLVLTFATSWLAWQGVVWNLAIGAPDQLAGLLMGARGSATALFAGRLDAVFGAIAQIAEQATAPGAQQAAQQQAAAMGGFSPLSLTGMGAMLLLLGTVGVLLTARIALGVLLALGPVFVILGLFAPTRGLTAGWLRALVLTAVTPLFVVAGGSLILEMLVPVIAGLAGEQGINMQAAMALFLLGAVHVALMALVLRVAGAIVAGWQVFGLAGGGRRERVSAATAPQVPSLLVPAAAMSGHEAGAIASRRTIAVQAAAGGYQPAVGGSVQRTHVVQIAGEGGTLPVLRDAGRARGVGSRFRAPPVRHREIGR